MADDAPPPNLPNRFVSQTEIDQVNARKEEAWKAVYERIGMEPPASLKEKEEVYDGRSLAEKLAASRAAKQEAYEQQHKLSNQFRALNPDEIGFLDEIALKKLEEDRRVKEEVNSGLKEWRAAVQARDSLAPPPIPIPSSSSSTPKPSTSPATSASKSSAPLSASSKPKPIKPGLKGVVVAKKRNRPEANPKVSEEKKEGANGGGNTSKDNDKKTLDPTSRYQKKPPLLAGGKGLVDPGSDEEEEEEEEEGTERKRRKVA